MKELKRDCLIMSIYFSGIVESIRNLWGILNLHLIALHSIAQYSTFIFRVVYACAYVREIT